MFRLKQVFLSSVCTGLEQYRDTVAQAIESLDDYKCVRMEGFGARDAPSQEVCRARIEACDVLVGTLGPWYGSRFPGTEKSYSEVEYDIATKLGMARLMFLSAENAPIPAALAVTDEERQKQEAFRNRVAHERQCAYFRSPFDLAIRVTQALYHYSQSISQQQQLVPVHEEVSILKHAKL